MSSAASVLWTISNCSFRQELWISSVRYLQSADCLSLISIQIEAIVLEYLLVPRIAPDGSVGIFLWLRRNFQSSAGVYLTFF